MLNHSHPRPRNFTIRVHSLLPRYLQIADSLKSSSVHVLPVSVGQLTDREQLANLGFGLLHADTFRTLSGSSFIDRVADAIKG